jgi:hypothetical protein
MTLLLSPHRPLRVCSSLAPRPGQSGEPSFRKSFQPNSPGDLVRVRDCEIYFHLPEGLPDKTDAVYVGHESGRYIVRALGRDWNIPMQCLEHQEEMLLGGRWLDSWDRRVRRTQEMIDRLDARMRAGSRLNFSASPHTPHRKT